MQMKTLYLFVKQVALPLFGNIFFLMNGLWQLNTDTVFKYSEQTKCTMQKHHPSTVSITIFVDFNGVTLYTPFCTANLKCSSRTIHHLVLKWLKLWLHTSNRKTRQGKKIKQTNSTNSNTILGLMPAVSYWSQQLYLG